MINYIKDRGDLFAAAIFLLVSFVMLNSSYSYWWDELFSVNESLMSIGDMLGYAMMIDQHPPLYHLLLKMWMFFFGDSEFSTRGLSLLFVFLSFVSIYINKKYFEDKYNLFVAVYLCSWPVLFYGNEARMYGLFLLLSTMIFIDFLQNGVNIKLKASSFLILISLTHYFGFVFSGLYLLTYFFSDSANKKEFKVYLLGFVLWLFPLIHFTFGNIGSKLGGEFWITSLPLGAFYKYATLLLPMEKITNVLNVPHHYLGHFTFICLTLTIIAFRKTKLFFKLACCIWCCLIFISIVDLHTPISTTRNFIVIFPLGVYCLSSILSSINNKIVNVVVIATLLCFSLIEAYDKVNGQNNIELANFIDKSDFDEVYFIPARKSHESWLTQMYNYYPEKVITPIELTELKVGDVFVSMHTHDKTVELYKEMGITPIKKVDLMLYVFLKNENTAKN